MLSSVEILILSIVQGVSEFLPVSSAAHLVLISKYYAFANQNLLIDICLHLGSLIAIILYFRNDLFNLVKNKSISMGKNLVEDTKNYQKKEWSKEKDKLNKVKKKVLEK